VSKIKVGDLVRYDRYLVCSTEFMAPHMALAVGMVTKIHKRDIEDDNDIVVDVMWSPGSHNSYAVDYLSFLEPIT
jgi:hypothetical protein